MVSCAMSIGSLNASRSLVARRPDEAAELAIAGEAIDS